MWASQTVPSSLTWRRCIWRNYWSHLLQCSWRSLSPGSHVIRRKSWKHHSWFKKTLLPFNIRHLYLIANKWVEPHWFSSARIFAFCLSANNSVLAFIMAEKKQEKHRSTTLSVLMLHSLSTGGHFATSPLATCVWSVTNNQQSQAEHK